MNNKRLLAIEAILEMSNLQREIVERLKDDQLYNFLEVEGYYWTGSIWVKPFINFSGLELDE